MFVVTQIMRILNRLLFYWHKTIAKVFKVQGKVLMLHHVGDSDKKSPYNLTVSSFENLLVKLISKNVVSLNEIHNKKDFIALTFDDVPDDFYTNAFPLLKKYKVPFTIFISCSLLDKPGYISREELKAISDCPLATIGSHGVSHKLFRRMGRSQKNDEYLLSKQKLEAIIGKEVLYFAFPFGSYSSCGLLYKKDLLKYYNYGFSTIPVAFTFSSWRQKYFLPRINVEEGNISKII